MIQITLTLAVPDYHCDEHKVSSEMLVSAATDQVIDALHQTCDVLILGWESLPLTLKVGKS